MVSCHMTNALPQYRGLYYCVLLKCLSECVGFIYGKNIISPTSAGVIEGRAGVMV